jgi:hypothetical protein
MTTTDVKGAESAGDPSGRFASHWSGDNPEGGWEQ